MSRSSYCWEQHPCKWFPSFPEKRERCAETRRSRAHMSSTHDEEAPQKLMRVVVYTTLSRAAGVQGIYRASISNICSAVAGTAYVACAEPFILWLPRLQGTVYARILRDFLNSDVVSKPDKARGASRPHPRSRNPVVYSQRCLNKYRMHCFCTTVSYYIHKGHT